MHTGNGEWVPMSKFNYAVDAQNQRVVLESRGVISRYDQCLVKDVRNWECKSGPGVEFGFRNGEHWETLKVGNVREASWLEWWFLTIMKKMT